MLQAIPSAADSLGRADLGGHATPLDQLEHAIDLVASEDTDHLADVALSEDLRRIRDAIDRLEGEFSLRLRRFARLRGHVTDGATSVVSWLRYRCRLSVSQASARSQVARLLPKIPGAEHLLRRAEIGFRHAAVLAQAVDEVGVAAVTAAADELISAARTLDPDRLRIVTRHLRHCVDPDGVLSDAERDYARRRLHVSPILDGLSVIDGRLDAEGAALLRTALEALSRPPPSDPRTPAQRRADALVELCRRQLQSGGLPQIGGERPHLFLTVSPQTLARLPRTPAGELRWAGTVPAETARRIACDAAVTEFKANEPDTVASSSRRRRTIPPAMRRALVARDGGCRYPSCDRPAEWTDAHHVRHWADLGKTELSNLILLCRVHHRMVHEGRVSLAAVVPGGDAQNAVARAP
jgi:Domain of unknown function (DUF222)/HNH endonuclease